MGKPPKIILDNFNDMLNFGAAPDTAPAPVQGGIMEMDFDKMESFPNHKFKLYVGKQFDDMAESIRQYGILQPLIFWHTEDNHHYILSGHNRKECGKAAGLTKGPIIMKENLTYEDAVLIVIETNLRQRSFADMSQSERAYCLFEHYKAMKSQGKRNDLILEIERLMNPHGDEVSATSAEISRSGGSRSDLAEKYSLTEDKVAKYIRIGECLGTPLMELFDEDKFSVSVANTLSFVESSEKQQAIVSLMESDNYKMDGMDEFKKRKLTATLKSAEINMTAEVYAAQAVVKAGLVLACAIPCLLIVPIISPVFVIIGIGVYFSESTKADKLIKARREEIEHELPRFAATLTQELQASRDVLSILETYQKNAGKAMKNELAITVADMRTGNYEGALTRFEARITSAMLSDVVRGLIGVIRGDDGVVFFRMLSHDMKQLELQRLKKLALERPPKIRKFSFMLLSCMLILYMGVMGYQILGTMSGMF